MLLVIWHINLLSITQHFHCQQTSKKHIICILFQLLIMASSLYCLLACLLAYFTLCPIWSNIFTKTLVLVQKTCAIQISRFDWLVLEKFGLHEFCTNTEGLGSGGTLEMADCTNAYFKIQWKSQWLLKNQIISNIFYK